MFGIKKKKKIKALENLYLVSTSTPRDLTSGGGYFIYWRTSLSNKEAAQEFTHSTISVDKLGNMSNINNQCIPNGPN